MATFVVEFQYRVDREGRGAAHRAHAAYLRDLADRGVLLLGGPLVEENRGLLVYRVGDRAELQRVLDREPYLLAGLVAETRISEWSPGKGSWIPAPAKPDGRAMSEHGPERGPRTEKRVAEA